MSTAYEPGSRLPGESRQAHRALRTYLEQGPTCRVVSVAEECKISPSLAYRWSSRWSWATRAAAYDAAIDTEYDRERRTAAREAGRRHAELAARFLDKITARLKALDPADLSPRDLARWFAVAAEVERRALGMGVRVEVAGPGGGPVRAEVEVDLTQHTDEERRARLAQLTAEAQRRLDSRPALVLSPDPSYR